MSHQQNFKSFSSQTEITIHELQTFYNQFGSFPNDKLLHILQTNLFIFPLLTQDDLINSQSILIFLHQQTNNVSNQNNNFQAYCQQLCSKIINGEFQYKKSLLQTGINEQTHKSNKQTSELQNVQTQITKQSYYQQQIYSKQILDLIFKANPKIHQIIKKENIQLLESNNVIAILDLLQFELSFESSIQLSKIQIISIFQNILIPICVNYSQFNHKTINLVKKCLTYLQFQIINLKQNLSESLTKAYLCFRQKNTYKTFPTDKQLKKILSYLTLIQAIHCDDEECYSQKIIKSQYFLNDIETLLLSSYVDPELSTSNSMAVNIYGTLLKQLNLYNKRAQVFINLYSTLSCFGTHLIKDVWESFYSLAKTNTPESKQDILFSQQKLIDIVFYKIQNHDNANVIKFCLQSILKSSQSYELFNCVPDAVYNSLIRMLNLGMNYLDCVFHMDSKMFDFISTFFCNFYNNHCKQQELQQHLRKFLKSIYQKLTFDHAIVAAFNCFTKIKKKTKMVGKQELQIISFFIKRHYKRFPIRKRNQLMKGIVYLLKNHLNSAQDTTTQQKSIKLDQLFINCLNWISDDYLKMTFGSHQMRKDVLKIIKKNYSKSAINIYIKSISDLILQQNFKQNYECEQQQIWLTLQKVLFIIGIQQLQVQTLQTLKNVYSKLYEHIIDFGDSLYKNAKERLNSVILTNQILIYKSQNKFLINFNLKSLQSNYNSLNFVKSVLNNLSLLISQLLSNQYEKQLLKLNQKNFIELVKNIFQIIYFRQQNQESLALQTIGAQFLQWATDKIEEEICVKMIITIVKTRIESSTYKKVQVIEQSIYQIHKLILDQQLNNKVKNQSQINVQISPILRLRLCVLTSNLLFSDLNYIEDHIITLLDQIQDFSDRYDYQNYDEVFNFIQNLFTFQIPADSKIYQLLYKAQENHIERIAKCLTTLFQSTLSNLDYGITTKQAISSSQCAIKIMFSFSVKHGFFNQNLVNVCKLILRTGQQYWMFQRTLIFALISQIKKASLFLLESEKILNWQCLLPLILEVICCQQYRGYDTAIVLQKYLVQKYHFYSQLKFIVDQQADYEGVICRFQFLNFIQKIQKKENKFYESFLIQIFNYLVPIVTTQHKQKMFLTGTHKTKLKVWQCLLTYKIQWIFKHLSIKTLNNPKQKFIIIQDCLIKILNSVIHNNLTEVRYYQEIFLMKMIINSHSLQIVTQKILVFLSNQLIQSISQVNKNISFLVISGILLSHLLNNCQLSTTHQIYKPTKHLFNSLLSFCCSHVAYFRGLSQFFCLQQNYFETDYTKILAQNYKNDADAIVLQQKLEKMINQYVEQICNWQFSKDILPKLPTLNNNVVSQTYYIQKMKRLGQQLIKEVKHQDGFLPYKDIWKTSIKVVNINQNQNENLQDQQKLNYEETQIFQKKIDPTLDFIYFSKSKLIGYNMKILITGSKSIPLYGHLSRTGQIFGLSQLIVPDKSIIELDQYKNVSCTAQKWLNITEFSNKEDGNNPQMYQLHLQQKIIELKCQNFQIIKISKGETDDKTLNQSLKGLKRNLLLIVDSENKIPLSLLEFIDLTIRFGSFFSQHVEASILIWEYLKKVVQNGFE